MEVLYLTRRSEWREWLAANFDKKSEVWLIYPKKSTGKPRIEYNTAVEEALCFGWIDSIVKAYDDDQSMQRFSVRRSKSAYSQANKERIRWLLEHELVHPSIKEELELIGKEIFSYPSDIIARIGKDATAWKHFQDLSEPYKRIRIAYIESARKRPEEFEKRIANFLVHTRENRLIKGFGGIEKYY